MISLLVIGTIAYFFINQWWKERTCDYKFNSFEHEYSMFSDCQIKVKGQWIPADSYRTF